MHATNLLAESVGRSYWFRKKSLYSIMARSTATPIATESNAITSLGLASFTKKYLLSQALTVLFSTLFEGMLFLPFLHLATAINRSDEFLVCACFEHQAICTAVRTAAIRLAADALPCHAISNAVPWSTEVRMIGRPSVTFTPFSNASILKGINPWS